MDRRAFLKSAGAAAAASPLLAGNLAASAERAAAEQPEPNTDAILAVPTGDALIETPHITLTGTWKFQLDPAGLGVTNRWFDTQIGPDTIYLPGSTDQAGYGDKTCGPAKGHLSTPYEYTGPAWYQTQFTLPEKWRGRNIALYMERCHWQTSVWLDGRSYGDQNSLSVPHIYDFGSQLEPGVHTLTLCVDNTIRINIGATAHAITEQTQTDWNGIIGKIQLRATPAVWIERVRAFPDIQNQQVRLELTLHNSTNSTASGVLRAVLREREADATLSVPAFTCETTLTMLLPMAEAAGLWDDLAPNLFTVDLYLRCGAAGADYEHSRSLRLGMREISAGGRQFLLNGRPVFLRGTVENAVFPLTAWPAMEEDQWRRIFRVIRSYGMNHLRFHSYCPPEAAFVAADEAGVLLHVELPVFSHHVGTTPGLEDFMRQEAHRILDTYGNHPSFALLCMGNELRADFAFLDQLVAELKQADDRRLYTYSTNNGRPSPGPTSQYWVTEETPEGRLRIDRTRFGATPGGTDYDFSHAIAPYQLPVVAHELGQWAVYPSYDELSKYTGVLKPRNLEVFRSELSARGMGDQAEIFQQASGRFSAEVYKEDIESAIRTPGLGGFQLLELTDYPGQQEALVGMLDCFWDSKSLVTPEAFRHFCGDTVPLLRFPKFVWQSHETFRATAEVVHYGKGDILRPAIEWSLRDDQGRTLRAGKLPCRKISSGGLTPLGSIEFPLSFAHQAVRLTFTLGISGTAIANRWQIWVYPASLQLPSPGNVRLATGLDGALLRDLQQGASVLLSAPPGQSGRNLLKMRFLPVFWSFGMFAKQPGTMGILCDPQHPALACFPTDLHSNWQWWELTEGTNAFILNDAPAGWRPLIQVIDDFHRNDRLGMVIEARVGRGRLLATSLCLTADLDSKPVTRQLLYSLLQYVSGEAFQPRMTLAPPTIERLLSNEG